MNFPHSSPRLKPGASWSVPRVKLVGVIKVLTEQRGNLQGVDMESILGQVYGPEAEFIPDPSSSSSGVIVSRREGQGLFDILDTVLSLYTV